jgi:hypothetical protein
MYNLELKGSANVLLKAIPSATSTYLYRMGLRQYTPPSLSNLHPVSTIEEDDRALQVAGY